MSLQQSEQYLDSLAYIDQEFTTEKIHAQAKQLIAEEQQYSGMPDFATYISHLPAPALNFEKNPFLLELLERVKQNKQFTEQEKSMEALDLPKQQDNVDAWQEAIAKAQIAIEYERTRLVNLQLMHKYGPQAWKLYADHLDQIQRLYVAILIFLPL